MSGPLQTGFQGLVNNQPAPAVAGDFAGANPRASILGGPGRFVSPVGGLTVGNIAWANQATGEVTQAYVAGAEPGFLRRDNQAIIVNFLAPAVFMVQQGFPITLYNQGDFWGLFAGGATPGQKVYADAGTGALIAGGANPPTVESFTASAGATLTGTTAAAVLTATAVTGFISVGDVITDGVTPATVVNQLTGPAGGAGTYTMSGSPGWVAASLTATSTVLDVTAVTTGPILVGDPISGSGVTAAVITGQLSGTPGGIGFYSISVAQQFASTAVGAAAIATNWKVNSVAANGELAMISTWG